jgi:hypothetical protein
MKGSVHGCVQAASLYTEVFSVAEADLQINPLIGYLDVHRGRQPLIFTPGQTAKRDVAGALNPRPGRLTAVFAERKNSGLFVAFVFLASKAR